MNKETFQNKLIKRFYGIAGPLDEFRRKEAMRLGNMAFIFLFIGLLFTLLLALSLSERFPEQVGYGYPVFLEIILLGLQSYLALQSYRSQLTALDREDLSEKEVRGLKWASVKFAVYFTLVMYLWNAFFGAWMDKDMDFITNLTTPRFFFAACLGGIFVGIVTHIQLVYRQKQAQNMTSSSAISKKEKPWMTKLIKHFYGVRGPLDECRREQADEIGGLAFVYLSWFLLISNAVAFMLAVRYTTEVATWYPILLGAILFILIAVLSVQLLNRDFSQFDPEEISPEEQARTYRHPLRWGIGVSLFSLIFSSVSDLFDSNGPVLETLFQPKNLFYAGFMGLFASIVISATNYVKRLEDQENQRKMERRKK